MAKTKTAEGKTRGHFGKSVPLLLIALPGIVYLLINNYIPMAGIVIAFKKLNFAEGIFASPWAGFENFKFLLPRRMHGSSREIPCFIMWRLFW